MKKFIAKLVLVIIIIFAVGYIYFNYIDNGGALSSAQQEIVETLGRPEQFALTYLPKGSDEGSEFVRQETWFYPSMKRKISFLNGEIVSTEELDIKEGVVYTPTLLKSEDFDFYSTLNKVKKITGNLEPMELPGFFDEGVETYASSDVMFVFENGYLTYAETLD